MQAKAKARQTLTLTAQKQKGTPEASLLKVFGKTEAFLTYEDPAQ
jgi:hypothetical protein